eukprot:3589200-Prymnesium_polylepis.1
MGVLAAGLVHAGRAEWAPERRVGRECQPEHGGLTNRGACFTKSVVVCTTGYAGRHGAPSGQTGTYPL